MGTKGRSSGLGEATVEHQKGKVIGMCSSLVLISYYRYPF